MWEYYKCRGVTSWIEMVRFTEKNTVTREGVGSPSLPTLSFVSLSSLPPPFYLPASHFSFSTLSGWHGPQPHVGISYSDHFQLMSSFISREQANSGRTGSSEREASPRPRSATFFISTEENSANFTRSPCVSSLKSKSLSRFDCQFNTYLKN